MNYFARAWRLGLKLLNQIHQERRGKREEGLTSDGLIIYPDNLLLTNSIYFGGHREGLRIG